MDLWIAILLIVGLDMHWAWMIPTVLIYGAFALSRYSRRLWYKRLLIRAANPVFQIYQTEEQRERQNDVH